MWKWFSLFNDILKENHCTFSLANDFIDMYYDSFMYNTRAPNTKEVHFDTRCTHNHVKRALQKAPTHITT